ncbi:MAG TPA: aldo/keto reductase [Longimicrobiaceae bacterium]|nr:aldo/keto reductase [Longimicrobiaceae bacterium]
MTMETRPLGGTGLRVTPLGLGLAALGRPGYMTLGHADDLGSDRSVDAMREHAHAVLDAAWEAGVRYFDAARSYGRAEEFLASWLEARGVGPGEATVGSKWGYAYTAGWRVDAEVHEVKEHSLARLRQQHGESRAVLGARLQLYQIHSASLDTGVLENAGVLDELARLRDAGLCIGLSTTGPRQADTLRRALEVRRGGALVFGAVQATWNLLEPSAAGALREAREAGMGVIVKEALSNGRLTDRNRDPGDTAKLAPIRAEAERLETTTDALALAAALARPWADVVLSGAAAVEHLRSNARALDVTWDEEAEGRLAGLAEEPEAYWERRGRLPWT